MNFLLFHLTRLVMLPFRIITSPKEMIGSLWNESGQNRALLLGLPSILFGVLGVAILMWAKFGIASSLENRYLSQLEDSTEEKSRLGVELNRDLRMLRASQPSTSESAAMNDLIPIDDPRRLELETLRNREKIYLQKLIDLNPQESDYLFRLGIVAFEGRNINRCLALMSKTSPLDEPGYTKGHLWQANYYLRLRAKTPAETIYNGKIALAHAEQCLKRDQDNSQAKRIKATFLLFYQNELTEAYQIFEELFQDDPHIYKTLVEINRRDEKTERNEEVLDVAIAGFDEMLKNETLNIAEEIKIWRELTVCFLQKKQYSEAEKRLLEEIERQSGMADNAGRIWVERALAGVYIAWTSSIDENDPDRDTKRLELLKKANKFNPGSIDLKLRLTQMAVGKDPEIAKEAISIYDAHADPDAPGVVLNAIGSDALSRQDYATALRYYEMARKKSPQNPDILNNLAYAYIVGDEPNPRRGLTLIDEAIRRIANNPQSKKYMTFFRDTRGQALMHLDQWTEATAEFEISLIDRPQNKKILEALIKCYRADGLDPSAYVERLRVVNENGSANAPDPVDPKSGQ